MVVTTPGGLTFNVVGSGPKSTGVRADPAIQQTLIQFLAVRIRLALYMAPWSDAGGTKDFYQKVAFVGLPTWFLPSTASKPKGLSLSEYA